jgi:hypothetical protein
MKYFIDTEFLEGTQKSWFGRNTKPTIDLISIGIVSEDGREYYAISKDFNLKEAWNRYDLKIKEVAYQPMKYKDYWIRDNVLKPIFKDIWDKNVHYGLDEFFDRKFNYKSFKDIVKAFGKTNKQIAEEIKEFINYQKECKDVTKEQYYKHNNYINNLPEFYGYYADYDWVVFCWLFGKMKELPTGFPMYCNDLKQMLDEIQVRKFGNSKFTDGSLLNDIKKLPNYPKQTNEHNALADSKFAYELYKFLKTI